MKEKAIIVGAGTYGQVYSEYLQDQYEVLGFVDDDHTTHGLVVNGFPVFGGVEYLLTNNDKNINIFVPIGNNKVRVALIEKIKSNGYKLPSFIHNTCIIDKSVKIGEAVYILPGCNIMPLTIIKDYVMISMGVNIAHHTILGKGSFFSQGNNVGASINVKDYAYSGIGVTLMTGVKEIGAYSLIGAGAVIIRDVPDYAVVVGNPGKVIKYTNQK
ncbi:acetyltransferase [Myroides odoratimimus]|uniref:acetyltransferase n=1 Tax=Myroides odoratimimus TaxID=76832 RepID=UPI002576459F|nr:acetyltransferase [Myroides odoratimimus]MDM1527391.1 acetyltransferase [Myroides odoratimimus]